MQYAVSRIGRIIVATIIAIILITSQYATAAPLTIAGNWRTIDDETGAPRGIVHIYQTDQQWQGQLIKIYYRPGESSKDICTKCTDLSHKNQPILGMVIMWEMQQLNANQWGNGYIIDPHNGNIYHCKITLAPDGQSLNIRGYIGIPLLGRSQTWTRISSEEEIE